MNWNAISAIGQVVGSLAVVISLIYLALQIRSQTTQARLDALHRMVKEQRDATVMFATEKMSSIFLRANKDFNSISEAESFQYIILATNLFRAWENAFLEHRDGNLDKNVWIALSRDYSQPMGSSSAQHIWKLRKQNYDSNFQKYVDSLELNDYVTK